MIDEETWKRLKEIAEEQRRARPSECGDPCCSCHRRSTYPDLSQCALNKPLWMVIPPEGVHISCPVHGKHFIMGSQVTCGADLGPSWRSEVHL